MVCFQTENPNLGKISGPHIGQYVLIYFMAIWNILWIFEILCDHSVHFMFILVHFSSFGIMHQEKSGNPGKDHELRTSPNGCGQGSYLEQHHTFYPFIPSISSVVHVVCSRLKSNVLCSVRNPVVGPSER
jgi:hypothetical protein